MINMDPTFTTLLSGATGGIIAKAFDGPLKSLEDIWYSSIGYRTDRLRKIAELKNHDAIEEYKVGITNETSKIPEKFLHEPELSIAGPALEASTYYVTDNSVRNMFEKLIASSMDSRKDGITRVSFVEIVKQMSPIDALFLKEFSKQINIPLIQLRSTMKTGSYNTLFSNIVSNDFNIDSKLRPQLPSSIDNLQRLGLVSEDYINTKNVDYDKLFKSSPEYSKAKKEIDESNNSVNRTIEYSKQNQNPLVQSILAPESLLNKYYPTKLSMVKGVLQFTSFGTDFTSVCL